MSQVLCVNSYEDLSSLVNKNTETVELIMVDKDKTTNYKQIIPYITIYAVDADEGKLMFLQCEYANNGNSNEEAPKKTSIGYHDNITEKDVIVNEEIIQQENGNISYKMNLQNIIDTGYKTVNNILKNYLNLNIEEYNINMYRGNTAFFTTNNREQEIGLSIQIEVTPSEFIKIKENVKVNTDLITQVDTLGIHIDVIIEQMNIQLVIENISKQLLEKHNLEDRSCNIFAYVSYNVISYLLRNVKYADLIKIAKEKEVEKAANSAATTEEQTQL